MVIYLIVFFLISIIGVIIFYNGNTDKKRKIFLAISYSILLLVMGFRNETVGTDLKSYCYLFELYAHAPLEELLTTESSILYILYNVVLSKIMLDSRILIFGNSFIILFFTARYIYKHTNHVFYSTLLFMLFYYYFTAFNTSRQYIAIVIAAFSIDALIEKKNIKFIILVIIATLIHNTALVLLILLPLNFIKTTKRNLFIYGGVVSIFFLMLNKFINIFMSFFEHYSIYTESIYTSSANRKIVITLIYIAFFIITMILFKKKKINEKEKREWIIYNFMNFFSIIFGFAGLKMMLLSRVEKYFSFSNIILIPKIFDKCKNKEILYTIFYIIMLIPMIILLKENNGGINPYNSWLF